MEDNYLRISDLVQFNFLSPELIRIKDDFDNKKGCFKVIKDAEQTQTKGLKVRIAATHAGIITENNMFYLPDKMKKSAPTFLQDFGKPILKHHNETEDPIGRVVDVFYVDTSGVIKDTYKDLSVKDNTGTIFTLDEGSLKDFCSGNMPFAMQVEVVRNFFNKPIKDGHSLLEDKSYKGLGHIQLICDITDPEAIQKFLDGRYLTGSVGAKTDRAVCSICKQDWIKSDQCEHIPGQVYDDTKMVIIAGKFFYEEYSVANMPADRQSQVLELYYNGNLKGIEIQNSCVSNVPEIKLEFPQYDPVFEKEKLMAEKAKEIQDSKKVDKEEIKSEESKEKSKENVQDKDKSKEVVIKTVDDFLTQIMDKDQSLSEEDESKFYEAFWSEVEDGFKSGEFSLSQLKVKKLEDAKLSTKKRKSLSKSAFCGPSKSFPVPDCAHVTAARRLIGRYKGPGDKSTILACVSRKAKAMGCDTKKAKDSLGHARVLHVLTAALEEHLHTKTWREQDGKDPLLSEEDIGSLSGIMKNLVVSLGKDNIISALSVDEVEFKDVMISFQDVVLLDEIVTLEETLGELRDSFDEISETKEALKQEYELLQTDVETLRDELVSEKTKVRDSKLNKAVLYLNLKEKYQEDRLETLKDYSDEKLDVELERLVKDVDIQKITDKLGDGTSRVPEGNVDDPTQNLEKTVVSECTLKDLKQEYGQIIEMYHKKKFQNQVMADQWLRDQMIRLKEEGKSDLLDQLFSQS